MESRLYGHAAEVGAGLTGEVRNFLISSSKSTEKLDLVALNIQRGRDHEVPFYNDLPESMGLEQFEYIEEIAPGDPTPLRKLNPVYKGNVEVMDPWICGITETHASESSLGSFLLVNSRSEIDIFRFGFCTSTASRLYKRFQSRTARKIKRNPTKFHKHY